LQIIVTALHKIPNERQFELASRYLCEQLLANFAKVSVLREAGASKPENLANQFRRPAQGQSPVPFGNPPRRENGSLPRNVCSTGSGPAQSLVLLSLAGGTTIRSI